MKYHFKTEAGIENWTNEEAVRVAGENPDYATEDLFKHIAKGGKAVWKAYVQIMPLEDAPSYRFNPFDVTKVWPHKDYPMLPFGRMVLDRNPANYFAEVEQSAFEPSNFVPGVEPSPDKMLQGRLFAYADAHRYRLGTNYALLPINCPHAARVENYQRDGAMRSDKNGGASANYEPNSVDGPKEAPEYAQKAFDVSGSAAHTPYEKHSEDDDFVQAGSLYLLMDRDQKDHLISNLAGHMKAVKKEIQVRQLCNFYSADADYGTRLGRALGIDVKDFMAPAPGKAKQPALR